MTANKTQQTDADVDAFIETVADAGQREDARTIVSLLSRASGEPARMWGPAIIGFGSYHYVYESGREGDMCRIGFSPRKGKTVLYMTTDFDAYADIMARLGKYSTGKSCLYVKRLSDINLDALEELARGAWASMAERYPG